MQNLWLFGGETSEQRSRVDQFDAVLGHPLSWEVARVLCQKHVGLGGQRSCKDVPIAGVHVHVRDSLLVTLRHLNERCRDVRAEPIDQ